MDFNSKVQIELSLAEFNHLLMFIDSYLARTPEANSIDKFMLQKIEQSLEFVEGTVYGHD